MAASGSGAVFFLGTRAHYQVLQQPEARFDMENGNASTESIYQNRGVQETWRGDHAKLDVDNRDYVVEEKEKADTNNVKRRPCRRASEAALCERDADMKPALLNTMGYNGTTKWKSSRNRTSLVALLTSLARRKRRIDEDRTQYLRHIESALNTCTYRESCRCLDCQSRYFECDESDEYSSDDSEYTRYVAHHDERGSDHDEVFVDKIPEDSTSTDLLIDTKEKMSVSSDEGTDGQATEEDNLHLEVAAGTPVLLNYLLHHPITCVIQ